MLLMCTLVLLRRPGHSWPLILAANRDEREGRPWLPPARHWDDREEVTAGLDRLAGGTWLGVSDRGLVAGVLNRPGTLGPEAGKRSRGELPLEALDHAEARAAAEALADLSAQAYRPFNLLVADAGEAFWLTLREGAARVSVAAVPEGLSMLTAHDLNDAQESARIRHFLPRFRAAPAPDPENGDWRAWQELLKSRDTAPGHGPEQAMNISTDWGFGTRSSSLIALAKPQNPPKAPLWRFCHGAPDTDRWTDIVF